MPLAKTSEIDFLFLVNSFIVGAVYSFLTLLFTYLPLKTNFTTVQPDLLAAFLLGFVSGTILSLILGFLAVNFNYSKTIRFTLILTILFIVGYLSNIVEYLFFSTVTLSDLYLEIAFMFIVYAVIATFIIYIFPAKTNPTSLKIKLYSLFSSHSRTWWTIRIFITGTLYVPVYLLFGTLFSPIITPFYTDPSYGLELVIPPLEVIIPLEIIRGIVYVVLLIPVIASVKLNTIKQGLLLAAILFGVGALPGLLTNQSWPILLRLTHGIEIAADSVVFGIMVSKILGKTH